MMNKRIEKKQDKIIGAKMIRLLDKIPRETMHIDKHGVVTNWNQLSEDTKNWILRG